MAKRAVSKTAPGGSSPSTRANAKVNVASESKQSFAEFVPYFLRDPVKVCLSNAQTFVTWCLCD